ncbi:MAG: hypothetical protein U0L62_08365 [Paludibacteraceae bacterium]|nr:hypothetical protein [Paludibacteraceae bacterium]
MNDYQLDQLLQQYADKNEANDKAIEQATQHIMTTVKHEVRITKIKKWVQILTYSFGIPVAIVLYAFCLITYIPEIPHLYTPVFIAIPVIVLAIIGGAKLRNFTPYIK